MARAIAAFLLVATFGTACAVPGEDDLRPSRDRSQKGKGNNSNGTGTTTAPSPNAPPPAAATCNPEDLSGKVDTTQLDTFFQTQMKAAQSPGLSVLVIGESKIKWAKAYGFAHIADNRAVTKDTLFMLASVSKTVTATALMQLIEDPSRGLKLDDDINPKLPFKVRNPKHEATPITYRMLLTHTSSLIDSDAFNASFTGPRPDGDAPVSLLDFEKDYVTKADSWDAGAPGTKYSYSNTATSLAGLLVEQISGMNLQEYSRKSIFEKLGMNESSWFLQGLDRTHIAMPYDGETAQGYYGYADYPDGQLRTSAPQLARFLIAFTQKGECGARILKPETVAEMVKVQAPAVEPAQGLIWYYETRAGKQVIGHNGADSGVSTNMHVDLATGKGYILLSNGNANMSETTSIQEAMAAMNDKLMELANTL